MSFLSESYDKPKLMEPKVIKKIINEQNSQVTVDTKIKNYLINLIKVHYKIVIGIIFVLTGLYWRYNEIKKRRKLNEE
jgi:hypothetical protein